MSRRQRPGFPHFFPLPLFLPLILLLSLFLSGSLHPSLHVSLFSSLRFHALVLYPFPHCASSLSYSLCFCSFSVLLRVLLLLLCSFALLAPFHFSMNVTSDDEKRLNSIN